MITGICLLTFQSCNSQKVVVNREVETTNDGKMLLGTQTKDQLLKTPYSDWYVKEHDEYAIDQKTVDELKKGLDALRDYPVHKLRFQRFVKPMVFGNTQINWEEAYSSFRQTALSVLTS